MDTELPSFPNSSGAKAYALWQEIIEHNFVAEPKVGIVDLIDLALSTQ